MSTRSAGIASPSGSGTVAQIPSGANMREADPDVLTRRVLSRHHLRRSASLHRRADHAIQALQHLRGFSLTAVRPLFRQVPPDHHCPTRPTYFTGLVP